MRQARVIFRPEGIHIPPRDHLRSIMFSIRHDDQPTTAADCQLYDKPIRIWFADTQPGDPITEIWFSRPELLIWKPSESRSGQDLVVEGGVILTSGRAYRLLLELHDGFCTCAWCQEEDIVLGESEYVDGPDYPAAEVPPRAAARTN